MLEKDQMVKEKIVTKIIRMIEMAQLVSANQCVCPGGHIWLCYQFIYCIYLLAQAGFSMYGRIFHINAKFPNETLIKNLKLKWYSVI